MKTYVLMVELSSLENTRKELEGIIERLQENTVKYVKLKLELKYL